MAITRKFGERRSDGYRFKCVNKRGDEEWLSPEAFEAHRRRGREWAKRNAKKIREKARRHYLKKKALLAKDPEARIRERNRRRILGALFRAKHPEKLRARQRAYWHSMDWSEVSFRSAVAASRRRGHPPPEISPRWLKARWEKQGGKCFWSHLPMETAVGSRGGLLLKVSVDRLDPSLGYTKANCVLSCWALNRARGTSSVADFRQFLEKLYGRGTLFHAG